MICEKCKKVFSYTHAVRYHKHMQKHKKNQNTHKQLVFKNKEIKAQSSTFEKMFNKVLVRLLYICYDFECLLEPSEKSMSNTTDTNMTYLHDHKPIAIVALAGGELANELPAFEYCDEDVGHQFLQYLNNNHEQMIEILKKHFWKNHVTDLII